MLNLIDITTDQQRNVFHIEFDIGESGLRYEIGEALGVGIHKHPFQNVCNFFFKKNWDVAGHNDEREVSAFLAWYGVSANHVVALPADDDSKRLQLRSAIQV